MSQEKLRITVEIEYVEMDDSFLPGMKKLADLIDQILIEAEENVLDDD